MRAKAVVNAAGPWVSQTLGGTLGINSRAAVRLIKGSHIVVRKLFEGDQSYILQQPDKRIIFAIPYERDFTLIGTTDVPYDGEPGPVSISQDETDYLCSCINRSFAKNIGPADVVWSYSGVRPLYDDAAENASAVTRDYVLDVEDAGGRLPVLSVFGGKITTYRRLAEHALEKLAPYFPGLKPAWTGEGVLPGGNMRDADFDTFLADLKRRRPFLPDELARRLARAYGTRVDDLLGKATSLADLGETFDGGLTGAEVDYLRREEWVTTPKTSSGAARSSGCAPARRARRGSRRIWRGAPRRRDLFSSLPPLRGGWPPTGGRERGATVQKKALARPTRASLSEAALPSPDPADAGPPSLAEGGRTHGRV